MNELSILMHLLSYKHSLHEIGASKKEILNTLNIKTKHKNAAFQELIKNLSNYVKPLGLCVKFNPLNNHWFLSKDQEISNILKANPFENKPRLAATLFVILVSCFQNSGKSDVKSIQKVRKKKTITNDLRDLEKMGYIVLNNESNEVKLTPLIGYELDLDDLLTKISLKVKNR
ncbi:MAG: hypothetical protein GF353_26005 [Candidatus Lokiarchaeota archaeon]|nr:hypothetical protein [Candidatus Lokiarchaeota archaeon]